LILLQLITSYIFWILIALGFLGLLVWSYYHKKAQYTCHEYREKLASLGIRQSFSAKGCPYDNAPMESFHAILKKELVYQTIFKSYEEAKSQFNLTYTNLFHSLPHKFP
jgi:transposase InsO family protein